MGTVCGNPSVRLRTLHGFPAAIACPWPLWGCTRNPRRVYPDASVATPPARQCAEISLVRQSGHRRVRPILLAGLCTGPARPARPSGGGAGMGACADRPNAPTRLWCPCRRACRVVGLHFGRGLSKPRDSRGTGGDVSTRWTWSRPTARECSIQVVSPSEVGTLIAPATRSRGALT